MTVEQPGDAEDPTLEYGTIDGYRIVYEHGPTSWGAYSDDVPGCFAIDKSRAAVERRMREAIAFHLNDSDQAAARKGA